MFLNYLENFPNLLLRYDIYIITDFLKEPIL